MDQLFDVFFSPQTIMLCLGIYAATFMVRRIVETTWPKIGTKLYYSKILLPGTPLVIGMALGFFMKDFGWPEMVGTSAGGRMLFGVICGLLSAGAYNRIREWLKGKKAPEGSTLAGEAPSIPPAVLDSLPPADDVLKSVPPGEPKAGD